MIERKIDCWGKDIHMDVWIDAEIDGHTYEGHRTNGSSNAEVDGWRKVEWIYRHLDRQIDKFTPTAGWVEGWMVKQTDQLIKKKNWMDKLQHWMDEQTDELVDE